MNEIDEKIKAALSEEEEAAIAQLGEQPGLFEMISMSFHGKQAWMTYYMWSLGFAVFLFGLYAFSEFMGTEDAAARLPWLLAMNICLAITVIIKVLSFMQMAKLEMLREIKRLELRLLSQK